MILYCFKNKKSGHPAGVFRIGSLGITPVVPYYPCACLLLFLYGASCSLCPPHRKIPLSRLDAENRNCCEQMRTTLPKNCPRFIRKIENIFCPVKAGNIEEVSFWLKIKLALKNLKILSFRHSYHQMTRSRRHLMGWNSGQS